MQVSRLLRDRYGLDFPSTTAVLDEDEQEATQAANGGDSTRHLSAAERRRLRKQASLVPSCTCIRGRSYRITCSAAANTVIAVAGSCTPFVCVVFAQHAAGIETFLSHDYKRIETLSAVPTLQTAANTAQLDQ